MNKHKNQSKNSILKDTAKFENYSSPLKKYSFSSKGRGCSYYGLTVKREYHFLSDLERDYFDIIDFKDSTIDIQENYSLLPIESTLLISEILGIPHPSIGGKFQVMTSDFFIIYKIDNQIKKAVRQIKPSKDLSNSRILEKFAIEETWWNQNGVSDWKVITEKQIDRGLAQRIRHLKGHIDLEMKESFKDISKENLRQLTNELKEIILGSNKKIVEIIESFDARHNLPGCGIRIFKHLACLKEVPFDLSRDDYGIHEERGLLC